MIDFNKYLDECEIWFGNIREILFEWMIIDLF